MGTVRYHLKNLSLPMRVPLDQLLCGSVGPPGADLVEQVREVAVVCDLRVGVRAEVVVGWLVREALVEVGGRHAAVAGALALPNDLTINLSGAEKPVSRHALLTATGGITGDVSGWVVNDASGNIVNKARIKSDGTSVSLLLDSGTLLFFR